MDAEPLSCVMAAVWLFAAGVVPVALMLGGSCTTCCDPDGDGPFDSSLCVSFSQSEETIADPDCTRAGMFSQTVVIPETFWLPVEINVSGNVNDDFLIDEESITIDLGLDPGPYPDTTGDGCVGAHEIGSVAGPYQDSTRGGVTFPFRKRQFVVSLRDTIGSGASWDVKICIDPNRQQDNCTGRPCSDVSDCGIDCSCEMSLPLEFASCFGSGVAATASIEAGGVSLVEITNAGSGYAKLGRVAPTITISGGSGTGATFTPTLAAKVDACGVDYWELSAVEMQLGSGYIDGDQLTISVAQGDTEQDEASASVAAVGRTKPELTLDTGNATVTIDPEYAGGGVWGVNVSAVTVTNGGSGYAEGDSIDFGYAADDVEVQAAIATANVVHDEPVATFSVDTAGGSGAQFEAVWELLPSNQWPAAHKKTYRLAAVNVINGGTGYGQYEQITISFSSVDDGTVIEQAWADTDEPDGSGTIQTVFVGTSSQAQDEGPAGQYVGSRTDALHSLTGGGGQYYKDDPTAAYVHVSTPGIYYREDASEPPYVSQITATVLQVEVDVAAVLNVAVDDDTASQTFGQIESIAVQNAGSGYLGACKDNNPLP